MRVSDEKFASMFFHGVAFMIAGSIVAWGSAAYFLITNIFGGN